MKPVIWKSLFTDKEDSFDDSEALYLQKLSEMAVSVNRDHLKIYNGTVIPAISPLFQTGTSLDCWYIYKFGCWCYLKLMFATVGWLKWLIVKSRMRVLHPSQMSLHSPFTLLAQCFPQLRCQHYLRPDSNNILVLKQVKELFLSQTLLAAV